MGHVWNSDKARNITVIAGLIVLFSLSLAVVFMSNSEMKKITAQDCKEELTKELDEASESLEEYIELRITQVTAIKNLFEKNYSELENGIEDNIFKKILGIFIEDSTYLDIFIQNDDGVIHDIEGNVCNDIFLNNKENTATYVTDAFNYLVDGELQLVYAVVVPFEVNDKSYSIITIGSCKHLENVIRHYDTLKSHIQISDGNGSMIAEIYDCDIKGEHALVEEISSYRNLKTSGWTVKAIVDRKVVSDISSKYTSVIYSQMLITITSFVLYFIVIVAASVSFTKAKKKMLKKKQDEINGRDKELEIQNELISAISKEYCAIYTINLKKESFDEIVASEEIKELFSEEDSIETAFENMCDDYVSPEFRDELDDFLDLSTLPEKLAKSENVSLEYQIDNEIWHKATFIVKKQNDDFIEEVLFVISDKDIERKRESEYKQTLFAAVEEANRANNSKSVFLSKVSHDIRTPINGIIGMVDIAKKNWEDREKVAECFDKLNNASKYLLSLVDDVLNMGKFEKGEVEFEEKIVNLDELMDECINDVLPMANEREIDVKKKNVEINNIKVTASPQHLKQLFYNILNNAVKYTEKGGAVRFYAQETGCDGAYASYRFIIADTGIGMSEEFVRILYEPFAQEYENARTTYQGIGLGLSIVKGIVDKMGGRIDVESSEGLGTTFTINLTMPVIASANNSGDVGNQKEEKDITGKKILVIEDNMLNMEIAVYMLEEAGVNVLTAENGKEGVELFERSEVGEIDMILMDVMMPVIDGLEATKMIRQMEREDAKTIPIVAMTANAFAEDVLAVKNVGMNDHIAKPIVMEKFFGTINCWIK